MLNKLTRSIYITVVVALLLLVQEARSANLDKSVTPTAAAQIINGHRVYKSVRYWSGSAACTGDLYVPGVGNGKKLLPVIIVIHGGAWKLGNRSDFNAMDVTETLYKENFAVFNIDYRLTGDGGEFPNNVSDVKHAAAYLQSNSKQYAIDGERIGIYGASAGAHLALMAGYAPNADFGLKKNNTIKAVVAFCPLTDLMKMDAAFVIQYIGCIVEHCPELYAKASPISYAETAIPTLLVHGDQDKTVPISQSRDLKESLLKQHKTVKLLELPTAGHDFTHKPGLNRVASLAEMTRFFKDNLQ